MNDAQFLFVTASQIEGKKGLPPRHYGWPLSRVKELSGTDLGGARIVLDNGKVYETSTRFSDFHLALTGREMAPVGKPPAGIDEHRDPTPLYPASE